MVEERGGTERLMLLTTLPVTLDPLTRTCSKMPTALLKVVRTVAMHGQDSING